MRTGYFDATVSVRGRPVREYSHNGDIYIEGRKNSQFELQFRNLSSRRVLVVPSVDGLSVMDGKPASTQSSGYIVNGYDHVTIPGWRLDNSEVARFVFQDKRNSYAEQTDRGGNSGVIGFMVFFERVYRPMWTTPVPHYPSWGTLPVNHTYDSYPLNGGSWCSTQPVNASMSTSATPRGIAPSSSVAKSAGDAQAQTTCDSFSLGTGFGEAETHQVTMTSFVRASSSPEVEMAMFYDSRRNLEKLGIVIDNRPAKSSRPNPFPGKQMGCAPPANWTRG